MRKLTLFFLMILLLASVSFAQELPSLVFSDGGSSEPNVLVNQTAIGENNQLQLGGVYWFFEVGTREVPSGTVKLYISRAGTDICVTWEASTYPNPQIFVLTGDGSGCYINNYDKNKWVKVSSGDTIGGTKVTIDNTNGVLTHEGQVGGGTSEAYYKGLLAGVTDYNSYIPSAEAVGKMNVELPRNTFKLINIPFMLSVANIRQVIGDQLSAAKLQYNENGLKQIILSGGSWDSEIDLRTATGYWLKSTDRDAVCTFYGGVIKERFSKLLPLGWDLYGYPLPKRVGPTTLGIVPVVGDKLQTLKAGALVQYYYGSGGWDDATFQIEGREGFWYWNPQNAPSRYLEVIP